MKNLTDDEVLKFQKGSPILFEDICAIYPPKIGEIVDIGYSTFEKYLSIITMEKPDDFGKADNELTKLLENLSDFQYILLIMSIDVNVNDLMKGAFNFFTHENILFSLDPAEIVIGPVAEQHLITEEKFYDLQKIIRKMCFLDQDGEEIIINKDDPPKLKELKKKMRASREKVRKAKAREAEKNQTNLKFSDLIGSITINNCGLNMVNIYDITYYAFHDQLKRMGWRDQFNINNRAALAGAKLDKKQLKHWMRSITNSES